MGVAQHGIWNLLLYFMIPFIAAIQLLVVIISMLNFVYVPCKKHRWWQLNDLSCSPLKIGEMIHPFDLRIFFSNGLVQPATRKKTVPAPRSRYTPTLLPHQWLPCRTSNVELCMKPRRLVGCGNVGLWWMTTFQKDEKVMEVEFLEIYFYPNKTIG